MTIKNDNFQSKFVIHIIALAKDANSGWLRGQTSKFCSVFLKTDDLYIYYI